MANDGPLTVHTIGRSNHPLGASIALLKSQRVEVLVDVRSAPRSGFVSHFS